MRRTFFPPLAATFRNVKGATLSDRDLLAAWARFSTEQIRLLPPDGDVKTRAQTRQARERVIALREASERPDPFHNVPPPSARAPLPLAAAREEP